MGAPLLLVIVGLELKEVLGINYIVITIVLENLFYGPSTCPGVEEDQFISQKAWSMINGRNICNSDRQKHPNKLALNAFQEKVKAGGGARIKINFKLFKKALEPPSF